MKAEVKGNALVVTSSMKAEDILKIKKARPEALALVEEEDGMKNMVFFVDVTAPGGEPAIENDYIVFDGTTHDEAKLATATVLLRGKIGDPKETVAELFGTALVRLQKLEATIPAVLETVNAEHAALLECISAE